MAISPPPPSSLLLIKDGPFIDNFHGVLHSRQLVQVYYHYHQLPHLGHSLLVAAIFPVLLQLSSLYNHFQRVESWVRIAQFEPIAVCLPNVCNTRLWWFAILNSLIPTGESCISNRTRLLISNPICSFNPKNSSLLPHGNASVSMLI